VVAATTWIGHRQMTRAVPAQPGQPPQGVMGALTTGVIAVVATTLPAGLLVYWATAGLWTVGQQAVLLR
jgi:membrane protein insertase Oxa1/YidC/SpoIIIJ